MYSFIQKVHTGYGAKRASYPMVAGEIPKGIRRPKGGDDNLLRPWAEVKNATARYILSSKTSTPAMAPTELPIQLLQGNFPRGLSGQSVGLTIYYAVGLSSKILQLHVYSPPQRPDRLWRQQSFLSNGCRETSQGDVAAKAWG
jgi:hypothetical protein